jgi:excisionase family DNA binding protein
MYLIANRYPKGIGMTPDHQQLIENTLQAAYARAIEMNTSLTIQPGKNPPKYTHEMMWNSPLGQDLTTIANYVEGHPTQEDIRAPLSRVARAIFGNTLRQGIRLPRQFQKTPLGEMMYAAFARYYPATGWMRTSEVVKLFGVKRQTIYDWVEEEKLSAYYVKGIQMFRRSEIEQIHAVWLKRKQQSLHHS